jgi:glycosyltransferase involved in cell wall biosynthesis
MTFKNEIKVSVCVISYNQQGYIRECLTSLIEQKTNFDYEIVVRDDKSSDSTYSIIKELSSRYPSKIKLLDSADNIGMNSNLKTVMENASGEYIALCEGDDFWTDRNKLQIQYDLAKKHAHLDFFVSTCSSVNDESRVIPQSKDRFFGGDNEAFFDSSSVLKFPGQFAPTASYFFRSSVVSLLPDWFDKSRTANGDFFIEMYASKKGGLYTPHVLSSYRVASEGSYTQTMNKASPDKKLIHINDMMEALSHMKVDFPELKGQFNLKESALRFTAALCYVELDDFAQFQNHITPIDNNFASKYHKLLVIFRKFKYVIKFVQMNYSLAKSVELFVNKKVLR